GDLGGQADCLLGLGGLERLAGQRMRARSCYEQALGIATASQNKRAEASSLQALGWLDKEEGNLNSARLRFQTALDIRSGINDTGAAECLLGLGTLDEATGELANANERYSSAFSYWSEIGDRQGQASALTSL